MALFFYCLSLGQFASPKAILPVHPVTTIHAPAGKNSDTADLHKSSMPRAPWGQCILWTWHRHNARHIGGVFCNYRFAGGLFCLRQLFQNIINHALPQFWGLCTWNGVLACDDECGNRIDAHVSRRLILLARFGQISIRQ